ncbi:MAG: 3-phosphoshikimate 1-carboxyvinyltransferase [Bacteroidetes bacterium]|nr:3-phosphoshikimate 1-carboxyvinyltransferase [Bacteroidota bacterium]MDA0903645.1 3-phosphoshikimate 1-carboxyvinyltransferase [Bacteroidota bacterium]
MILRVLPSTLSADSVWAPPSKSVMQRVVALATLADGTTMIRRPSESDDCTHALMMAAQLGAEVELGEDAIAIHGTFPLRPRSEVLTPGESGLGLRMFGALAGLHHDPLVLERMGTLRGRNLSSMQETLESFGVRVEQTTEDHPRIVGPMRGAEASLDAAGSSQLLTGLLCALPHAEGNSVINLHGVVSRPYLDMTLEVLEDMGIHVHILEDDPDERRMLISIPGGQRATPIDVAIDGDWSAAAFLMSLGVLISPHHLDVEGLHSAYTQADEAIKGAMLFGGCKLAGTDEGVRVMKGRPSSFQVDLTDCPDLFPPLAALAVFGTNSSHLRGLHRLSNKESNRGLTLQREFAKCGISVDLDQDRDCMTIHPGPVQSARISSHGDHRIAMAAAVLGAAGAPVEIEGAECVAKSWPSFFDDLEALGIHIQKVAG